MKVLLLTVVFVLLGCAGLAWPPMYAHGDAEVSICEKYTITTVPDGTVTQEWHNCRIAQGGTVSEQAVGFASGTARAARKAVGATLGFPLSNPPQENDP